MRKSRRNLIPATICFYFKNEFVSIAAFAYDNNLSIKKGDMATIYVEILFKHHPNHVEYYNELHIKSRMLLLLWYIAGRLCAYTSIMLRRVRFSNQCQPRIIMEVTPSRIYSTFGYIVHLNLAI